MSRQRQVIEEPPAKAPVYIITFSTLAALLLAFFVVLISMGSVRDETLLDEGQGGGWSFLESFHAGFEGMRSFGAGRTNYYHSVSEPEKDAEGRTIDAKGERTRRALAKLGALGAVLPSPVNAEKVAFALADVGFVGESTMLDDAGKRFLKNFSAGLLQDISPGQVRLCVLCLAPAGKSSAKDYRLAAGRANAVEQMLIADLPAGGKWDIYSWGAASDNAWAGQDRAAGAKPQVLIAILR